MYVHCTDQQCEDWDEEEEEIKAGECACVCSMLCR